LWASNIFGKVVGRVVDLCDEQLCAGPRGQDSLDEGHRGEGRCGEGHRGEGAPRRGAARGTVARGTAVRYASGFLLLRLAAPPGYSYFNGLEKRFMLLWPVGPSTLSSESDVCDPS